MNNHLRSRMVFACSIICIILFIWFQTNWHSSNINIFCINGRNCTLSRRSFGNFYSLRLENDYQQLYVMTNGAVQQGYIIEKFRFFFYDLTRPVPKIAKNNKCVLLKNSNPQYSQCFGVKGSVYNDCYIWEPGLQNFINHFFDKNPDAMFVDLGMNIGLQSLYAASINSDVQVLGVETYLENVLVLHKSVHQNNFQKRFTVR